MSTLDHDIWICEGGTGSKEVPLTGLHQGKFFIVSPADYEKCMRQKWYLSSGYPSTWIDGKQVRIQQFITERDYSDHINGNKLDNRRENLFRGGQSNNIRNINKKTATSTSQFAGVGWYKRYKKWRARIHIDKKYHHLGYFENEVEAAYVYYKAAKQQHPYMQLPGWQRPEFLEYVLQQDLSQLNV